MAVAVFSGDLITDAVRTTGTEGDNRDAPDSSVGIWPARSNLVPNPNATTNTTGYAGVNSTLSRDTTFGFFGTTSFKLVCTGAGNAQLFGSLIITGAPMPQDRYVVSAWVKPTAGLIGKQVQIQINENGGAQATTFHQHAQLLVAGEQRVKLIIPALDEIDRTSFTLFITVSSPVAADEFHIGGIQIDDSTTIVTPYVATARTAGRVTLPATGLSTHRGWFAARLRPDWGDGVPPEPVVLADWSDDATHRIRLFWEGGRWKLSRISPGGTETAAVSNAVINDTETTVIGRWSPAGVSVSIDGDPFQSSNTLVVSDDFERPDQSGWGTPPVGNPWGLTGTGETHAFIQNGMATVADTYTLYAYQIMDEAPTRISASIVFPSAANPGTIALLSSIDPRLIYQMCHFIASDIDWAMQVTETDPTALVTILSGTYQTPILLDDTTVYDFAITFTGNTAYLELPDGQKRTITDSRIGPLNGRYVTWENFNFGGAESVRYAAVSAEIGSGSAETSGGFFPTIANTRFDVGTNGSGTGIVHGQLRWVMAGRGQLSNTDAVSIAAISGDPARASLNNSIRVRCLWKAETTALGSFQPRSYLGTGGLVPNWS